MLLKCVIYTTAVSTESSHDSGPFYPATVSIKPALTYFTVGNLCFHLSVCSVTVLRVSLLFSHNVQCLNVFLFFLIFMCHIFPSVSKSGNDECFLCILCLIWRHLMHQPGQDKTTSVNHRFNKDVILGYWFPSHCSYWLCKMQGPISGAWIYGCILIRQQSHMHYKNCFHPSRLSTQRVIVSLRIRHQPKWLMTLQLSKLPFMSSVLLIKIVLVMKCLLIRHMKETKPDMNQQTDNKWADSIIWLMWHDF